MARPGLHTITVASLDTTGGEIGSLGASGGKWIRGPLVFTNHDATNDLEISIDDGTTVCLIVAPGTSRELLIGDAPLLVGADGAQLHWAAAAATCANPVCLYRGESGEPAP